MLTLTLAETDDRAAVEIGLEHSLVSLSKWEAKHEKAFFGKDPMTPEESISYFQFMLLDQALHENWVERLTVEDFKRINAYINSKQSATWFREDPNAKASRDTVTNELIYSWMIKFQIPFDPCEHWHVNRLMTLIKICGIQQQKPQKMSPQQQAEEYRRLNAERRAALNTAG